VKPLKVLLTGGTGFIGNHLLRRLGEEPHEVSAFIRRGRPSPPYDQLAEWIPLRPFQSVPALCETMRHVDVLVHLAGRAHISSRESPRERRLFFETNAEFTRTLARAAVKAGVRRFIYMSSIGVVTSRGAEHAINEASPLKPETSYGQSKLAGEEALREESARAAMEYVILRVPLVYGPGNRANMARLIRWVLTGIPLPFASVRNRRSFLSVFNAVDLVCNVLTHPNVANQAYCISENQDVSISQLVEKIAEAAGVAPRLISLPQFVNEFIRHVPIASKLVNSLYIDSSKIQYDLDWQPPASMDDTLREMCREYKASVSWR